MSVTAELPGRLLIDAATASSGLGGGVSMLWCVFCHWRKSPIFEADDLPTLSTCVSCFHHCFCPSGFPCFHVTVLCSLSLSLSLSPDVTPQPLTGLKTPTNNNSLSPGLDRSVIPSIVSVCIVKQKRRARAHTHTHRQTQTHTHTHTHTQRQTHTDKHTQTNTQRASWQQTCTYKQNSRPTVHTNG